MKTVTFLSLFFLSAAYGNAQLVTLAPAANPEPQEYYVDVTLQDDFIDRGKEHSIRYAMSVTYLSADEEDKTFRIQLDRLSDVFVDSKQSNLNVAYNLSVHTSGVIFPMLADVSVEDGKIKDIVNFAEIQLRWEKLKKELSKTYTGDGLEEFFRLNDVAFSEQRDMTERLQNDCFFQFFFSDIYGTYQPDIGEDADYYIPFIYSLEKPVRYAGKRVLRRNRTVTDGNIYVEAWGYYADERSRTDLKWEERSPYYKGEMPEGDFRIHYFLDNKYHTIASILVATNLEIDRQKKLSVHISGNYEGRGKIKWQQTKLIQSSDKEKIYIPKNIFEGENEDIINQLNPLIKASFVNAPVRKHEGIKVW
ncbi:hypothetical protein [Dysgonomonas sp. 25]|uniref:hypothetical protein n=1 Tax=Dysgonomonas sp. 25 TaxID=2302933 RepID=UPI0013D56873|nr:hypothetical protein [Dysgonomonas sp. 25]NDV69224.1 hypothetical protein [Dysgonomonas sp. 25]